ncbi:hypothetical protein PYCC9005_004070 [Savitreella phatthalungensis]
MTDPWSQDWNDDFGSSGVSSKGLDAEKSRSGTTTSSKAVWEAANAREDVDYGAVAPSIGYKPSVKILRRDAGGPSPQEAERQAQAAARASRNDSGAAREQRYQEARHRLFGAESQTRTPSPKLDTQPKVDKPQRQARGPDSTGTGFSQRGRGR